MTRSALSLTGIRRRYGDVGALDNASLAIEPGTIHVLLGEHGGNQQRLILALELDGDPTLFVASNPARGLDVARRAGMAVVYHTPDLDELLEVSDRILVMFDGRVSEVPRDRESVGRAMLGAA